MSGDSSNARANTEAAANPAPAVSTVKMPDPCPPEDITCQFTGTPSKSFDGKQNLESVEDVMKNPDVLKGRGPEEVESILRGSKGWEVGTLNKGRSAGSGWTFRELNSRGTDYTGRYIQWHPGSSRHFGGSPYWKVSNGELGTVRIAQ